MTGTGGDGPSSGNENKTTRYLTGDKEGIEEFLGRFDVSDSAVSVSFDTGICSGIWWRAWSLLFSTPRSLTVIASRGDWGFSESLRIPISLQFAYHSCESGCIECFY